MCLTSDLAVEALRLVCSEGQVTAKICAPPTVPAATLQSCLAIPAPSTFSAALVAELASLPDLTNEVRAARDGLKCQDVDVENLELRYGGQAWLPSVSQAAFGPHTLPQQLFFPVF